MCFTYEVCEEKIVLILSKWNIDFSMTTAIELWLHPVHDTSANKFARIQCHPTKHKFNSIAKHFSSNVVTRVILCLETIGVTPWNVAIWFHSPSFCQRPNFDFYLASNKL